MPPVSEEDQARIKALLTEAVTALCKDGLQFSSQLSIEGLLGITIDRQDIFLVNIKETIDSDTNNCRPKRISKTVKRVSTCQKKKTVSLRAKRRRKDEPATAPIGPVTVNQVLAKKDPGQHQNNLVCFDPPVIDCVEQNSTGGSPKEPPKKTKASTAIPNKPMADIHRAIIGCEGCIVLSTVLQRRKFKYTAKILIKAMMALSRSQSDRHYIGEYREIGFSKIFYKCPPELLHSDALLSFSISMQEYRELFYRNFMPIHRCPNDWAGYVATVLENTPYNPMLFPLDASGLNAEQKQGLAEKQLERQREFRRAVADDSDEEEDQIEEGLCEMMDIPEMAFSPKRNCISSGQDAGVRSDNSDTEVVGEMLDKTMIQKALDPQD